MRREVGCAAGDEDVVARLEQADHMRKLGGASPLMMAEGLAVGGDQDGSAGGQRESGVDEGLGEFRSVPQNVAERDMARQVAVEAENREIQIIAPPQERSSLPARAAE